MTDIDIPFRWGRRNRRGGLIYYIGSPEMRRIKIGYTSGCPFKRLRALQTGSPCDLTLMIAHPGTIDDEKSLHLEFDQFSVRGEWFDMSPELVFHVFTAVIGRFREYEEAGEEPPAWIRHRYETLIESMGVGLQ